MGMLDWLRPRQAQTLRDAYDEHLAQLEGTTLGDKLDEFDVIPLRSGMKFVGEIPPEAGKLLASTVFQGLLFLAFEGGLWCVMDGKLRKVTIDNWEA